MTTSYCAILIERTEHIAHDSISSVVGLIPKRDIKACNPGASRIFFHLLLRAYPGSQNSAGLPAAVKLSAMNRQHPFFRVLMDQETGNIMRIKYNAPVILTYSIISMCALLLCNTGMTTKYFSSPAQLSFSDPYFYFRLVSYITGHASWRHLMGNLTIILLVGPLLEEKYGSATLLEMIFITAIATALFNAFLFSTSLIGGSGIAFMLILLGSFSNIRSREIPLTFIIIAVLFIGNEVVSTLKIDRISQFSHLAGGFIGAGYGFLKGARK